jgi:uncharacterized protein (DUF1800 family)
VALACALLAACGSGGGGASSTATTTDTSAQSAAAAAQAAADAAATAQKAKEVDAVRLAKQASFGATPALVSRVLEVGTSAWLDEQFAATGSTYADIAGSPVVTGSCNGDGVCTRHNFSREPVAMRFYANALSQPDQLRQRVAFALSQLMVASEAEVLNAAGLASLNQIFLDNAFGNFRTIMLAVTMNGTMGDYLDMVESNRTAPSENYAREFLQLFSIGPDRLNMDGTSAIDGSGATIANYGPDDIRGVARALTGWTFARLNGAAITDNAQRDWSKPMVPFSVRYDTTAKSFLGVTVPAGAAQADSVSAVVNAAFNHASAPPYIAKFLIRHLVTANPSPAYVGRVAAVFVNNGSNVRGDMKATVRAILTDPEARAAPGGDVGKVKEPILLMTGIARAVGMVTDGYVFTQRDTALGQPVFRAPSVFNFYPPDYPLPQSATLVSPASKLMTTPLIVARHNLVYDWTIGALTTRSEFAARTDVTGSTGTAIDWSAWEGLDVDAAVDRIDLILMNRTMSAAQKTALKSAANAVTNAVPATQARARAQAMLYIVGTSPLFQVDR